jgi:hypothetical protein
MAYLPSDLMTVNDQGEQVTGVRRLKVETLSDAALETSARGSVGVGVYLQDQTTAPLEIPFLQGRGTHVLQTDTSIGDYTIEVEGGSGILDGEVIELAKADGTFYQGTVVVGGVVVGPTDTITLDLPVNAVYVAGVDTVQSSSQDMLVDGSVTPQVFSILPLSGQSGDITRIIIILEGDDTMDSTGFGSNGALSRGVLLRYKNQNGTYRNLFQFKTNGEIAIAAGGDLSTFTPTRQGNTTSAVYGRVTFSGQEKRGVVLRVEGDRNEAIEAVVQDKLDTGINTKFRITAHGHELQE